VFKFFEEEKLTPQKLRELNQHQIEILSGGSRNDANWGVLGDAGAEGCEGSKSVTQKEYLDGLSGRHLAAGTGAVRHG
jgi:hypothetical protein